MLATIAILVARSWSPFAMMCEVDFASISESSGLAASNSVAGVFYTHNDSGDTARFFRFNKQGTVTGTFTVSGASAVDWEDMAPATIGGMDYLYFGDIGDNGRVRPSIQVYRVVEPGVNSGSGSVPSLKYELRYPDGAHNCEGMFVTPSGDIWLVTKESNGQARVYSCSPLAGSSVTLAMRGTLSVDTGGFGGKLVTGAALSSDGSHVAVRTYSAVLEFEAAIGLANWWTVAPRTVGNLLEIQGEAVTYSRNRRAILTSSEGFPAQVSISQLRPEISGSD